jgi:hypothetical protein
MDEQEWMTSESPDLMLSWLLNQNCAVSPRQYLTDRQLDKRLRLFSLACANFYGETANRDWIGWALRPEAREYEHSYSGEEAAKWWCGVYGLDSYSYVGATRNIRELSSSDRVLFSGYLREVFGNPYCQIHGWCDSRSALHLSGPSGWFLHVKSLEEVKRIVLTAADIFDSNSWECVGVLADALEDAGCPETVEVMTPIHVLVWEHDGVWSVSDMRYGTHKKMHTDRRREKAVRWAEETLSVTAWSKGERTWSGDGTARSRVTNSLLFHLRDTAAGHFRGCWAVQVLLEAMKKEESPLGKVSDGLEG